MLLQILELALVDCSCGTALSAPESRCKRDPFTEYLRVVDPTWCPLTEWFISFFASAHIWHGNRGRLAAKKAALLVSGMLL